MIFKKHRTAADLNASSMADIAFLLLIFFLVTTVIDIEKGIFVKLPEISELPPPSIHERNVFNVKINAEDKLLAEGQLVEVEALRPLIKDFIMNPDQDPSLSVAPNQALISLQNDRGTTYKTYLAVYNELKAAYRELWEASALELYGKPYDSLGELVRKSIRDRIPMVISEAEPSDFAQN
mgnify:CR=1 FL=1